MDVQKFIEKIENADFGNLKKLQEISKFKIKIIKLEKEKIALIVKTNHKLEVNFLENKNNIVKNYNKIKG